MTFLQTVATLIAVAAAVLVAAIIFEIVAKIEEIMEKPKHR